MILSDTLNILSCNFDKQDFEPEKKLKESEIKLRNQNLGIEELTYKLQKKEKLLLAYLKIGLRLFIKNYNL